MSEPISMEEFRPISIDYLHGRRIEEISEGGEGDEWTWVMHFEGDAKLFNYNPLYPVPSGLEGLIYQKTIFSAEGTTLYFGSNENPTQAKMNLDPLQYAISDPIYTEGKVVMAQRSRANMPPEAPPYPAEREWEGPEEAESEETESDEKG